MRARILIGFGCVKNKMGLKPETPVAGFDIVGAISDGRKIRDETKRAVKPLSLGLCLSSSKCPMGVDVDRHKVGFSAFGNPPFSHRDSRSLCCEQRRRPLQMDGGSAGCIRQSQTSRASEQVVGRAAGLPRRGYRHPWAWPTMSTFPKYRVFHSSQ